MWVEIISITFPLFSPISLRGKMQAFMREVYTMILFLVETAFTISSHFCICVTSSCDTWMPSSSKRYVNGFLKAGLFRACCLDFKKIHKESHNHQGSHHCAKQPRHRGIGMMQHIIIQITGGDPGLESDFHCNPLFRSKREAFPSFGHSLPSVIILFIIYHSSHTVQGK